MADAATPAVKVCGLTRLADARLAESLGAAYLGFVLAASPRRVSVEAMQAIVASLETSREQGRGARARIVGVFVRHRETEIARIATRTPLDVIQLHGALTASQVARLRTACAAAIWAVVPVEGGVVDAPALEAAAGADAVLLDARVGTRVGGTGVAFDWERAARALEPMRGRRPIILAGGLHPSNVARAVALFAPDIVDVSSGVEARPGRKDPARLRAFVHAVLGVTLP